MNPHSNALTSPDPAILCIGDFVVTVGLEDGVVKIKVDLGPHNQQVVVNRDLIVSVGPSCGT